MNETTDFQTEMMKLDSLTRNSGGMGMPFKETCDHKNIYLYTSLNKRIGALAPENAKYTMMMWQRAGIDLYLSPRTPEQIEEYKKTDKYKKLHEEWKALRKRRRLASKGKSSDEMAMEIAKATGMAVAEAMSKKTKKEKNVSS